ncbi:hypothetical protein M3Y94_01265700 [Aphelenchoides besseyi]|nr:hypothetical protein M3Y94_01265700 [Aphelenchoides besseyi]KAI6222587.1 hypothetical protein M3Y95_00909300 [Aphelenchoides besseyi]
MRNHLVFIVFAVGFIASSLAAKYVDEHKLKLRGLFICQNTKAQSTTPSATTTTAFTTTAAPTTTQNVVSTTSPIATTFPTNIDIRHELIKFIEHTWNTKNIVAYNCVQQCALPKATTFGTPSTSAGTTTFPSTTPPFCQPVDQPVDEPFDYTKVSFEVYDLDTNGQSHLVGSAMVNSRGFFALNGNLTYRLQESNSHYIKIQHNCNPENKTVCHVIDEDSSFLKSDFQAIYLDDLNGTTTCKTVDLKGKFDDPKTAGKIELQLSCKNYNRTSGQAPTQTLEEIGTSTTLAPCDDGTDACYTTNPAPVLATQYPQLNFDNDDNKDYEMTEVVVRVFQRNNTSVNVNADEFGKLAYNFLVKPDSEYTLEVSHRCTEYGNRLCMSKQFNGTVFQSQGELFNGQLTLNNFTTWEVAPCKSTR